MGTLATRKTAPKTKTAKAPAKKPAAKAKRPAKSSKPSTRPAAPALDPTTPTKPGAKSIGRPTEYNESWPDILPEMFADGQSVLEVSVALGISKDSFYEYVKKYPAFSDAFTRGRQMAQAWWERQGRIGLFDINEYDAETKTSTRKVLNAKVWERNMFCRFPDEWRHSMVPDQSGSIAEDKSLLEKLLAPEGGNP